MAYIRLDADTSFLSGKEVQARVVGIQTDHTARGESRLRVQAVVRPPAHLEREGEVLDLLEVGVLFSKEGRWVAAPILPDQGRMTADCWRIDQNARQDVFSGPDAYKKAAERARELAAAGKLRVRLMAHPSGWQVVWNEDEPDIRFVPRTVVVFDGEPLGRAVTVRLAQAVGAMALHLITGGQVTGEAGSGCNDCLFYRLVRYHRPEREAVDEGADKEIGALVTADGLPTTGFPLRHFCLASGEWLDRPAAELAASAPSRQSHAIYEREVVRLLQGSCPLQAWASRDIDWTRAWQPVLPTAAIQGASLHEKEIRMPWLRVGVELGAPVEKGEGIQPVTTRKQPEQKEEIGLLYRVAAWMGVLTVRGRWKAGKPLPQVAGFQVTNLKARPGQPDRVQQVTAVGEVEGRPVTVFASCDKQRPDRRAVAWINVFEPGTAPLIPNRAALKVRVGITVHEHLVFLTRLEGLGNPGRNLGRLTIEELRQMSQS